MQSCIKGIKIMHMIKDGLIGKLKLCSRVTYSCQLNTRLCTWSVVWLPLKNSSTAYS